MAKTDFNIVATKISSIFKNDIFIMNYMYCVGGIESESKNESQILLLFDTDVIEILKELFPDNPYIWITDIKGIKTDFNSCVKYLDKENGLEFELKRVQRLVDIMNNIKSWNTFDFTQEEKNSLLDERDTLILFKDNDKIPSLKVAKSLFPMVTDKNIDTLYYSIISKKDAQVTEMVTSLSTDYFQVYNLIQYISLDD